MSSQSVSQRGRGAQALQIRSVNQDYMKHFGVWVALYIPTLDILSGRTKRDLGLK